jgi:hypothetical protein
MALAGYREAEVPSKILLRGLIGGVAEPLQLVRQMLGYVISERHRVQEIGTHHCPVEMFRSEGNDEFCGKRHSRDWTVATPS